jgi:hypothetical protein
MKIYLPVSLSVLSVQGVTDLGAVESLAQRRSEQVVLMNSIPNDVDRARQIT